MNNSIFEKNLLALSAINPQFASRLSGKTGEGNRYRFLESRSGEMVPAIVVSGNARPLHSAVDPVHEAQRLVSTITEDTGFVVFLGLGGGFAPKAALEKTASQILVIDFDIDGIAELFSAIDYSKLLANARFSLLIDPAENEIKKSLLEQYRPALCGGIRTIPLRSRIEQDTAKFDSATDAIHRAVESVAADYSVQAHFGARWFSNIIRNIAAETGAETFNEKKINEAAIVAAGPSLDLQLPLLAECKSKKVFIICSDTALPVLLHHNIEPDAVVSIDCQHISYYHFWGCKPESGRNIPLFLDITSPPMLSRFSSSPLFFSSGHPLALYCAQHWKPLPRLDTSGGNVTYACLSLAESFGARNITLFGADFAYIQSRTYTKGTYIYSFFEKKQNRFSPAEALFSKFLYRSPFLGNGNEASVNSAKKGYYETAQLRFYRKKLEEKAAFMNARITAAQGQGAPINLPSKMAHNARSAEAVFGAEKAKMSGKKFLKQYGDKIAALPSAGDVNNYMNILNAEERQIFTTLLPLAAAVKKRNPLLKTADLIEEARRYCVRKIELVLGN